MTHTPTASAPPHAARRARPLPLSRVSVQEASAAGRRFLLGLIDGELALERRARPVKTRRRGASPGELVVSLAECQLVGGAFFDHLERPAFRYEGLVYARPVGRGPARRHGWGRVARGRRGALGAR